MKDMRVLGGLLVLFFSFLRLVVEIILVMI